VSVKYLCITLYFARCLSHFISCGKYYCNEIQVKRMRRRRRRRRRRGLLIITGELLCRM
jgi:hypothetical protein